MTRRNIKSIPPGILARIKAFDQDDVVVATAKFIKKGELSRYAHLGLMEKDGHIVLPAPAAPDPGAGRFSKANVYGLVKKRTDLPKITKDYSWEAPNFGDWYNGSHTVNMQRLVYRTDFYPPKEVELSIELLEETAEGYSLKFAIDQVINRRTPNFEQELFYNLNLLQENVYAANVFTSAASLAEYAETIRVDWEILPPGTVDEVVARMLRGKKAISPDLMAIMQARIGVMAKLKPDAYIAGTSGFLRYFGAKFGDDFVAFENVRYGNAIYVMYENWADLSKRSRVDLLSGPEDSFDRIEHRDGWEEKFENMVESYRTRLKQGQAIPKNSNGIF